MLESTNSIVVGLLASKFFLQVIFILFLLGLIFFYKKNITSEEEKDISGIKLLILGACIQNAILIIEIATNGYKSISIPIRESLEVLNWSLVCLRNLILILAFYKLYYIGIQSQFLRITKRIIQFIFFPLLIILFLVGIYLEYASVGLSIFDLKPAMFYGSILSLGYLIISGWALFKLFRKYGYTFISNLLLGLYSFSFIIISFGEIINYVESESIRLTLGTLYVFVLEFKEILTTVTLIVFSFSWVNNKIDEYHPISFIKTKQRQALTEVKKSVFTKNVKEKIEKNKIKDAIADLLNDENYKIGKTLKNEVIAISSLMYETNAKMIYGILSNTEYNLERNKVVYQLLHLIDRIK